MENKTSLYLAKEAFLAPNMLDENHLHSLLGQCLMPQIDDADLYFQSIQHEGWVLEDSKVKTGEFNIEQGVGIRVITGDKTGFAYSEDFSLAVLQRAANAASSIARYGQTNHYKVPTSVALKKPMYSTDNPINSISDHDKLALLNNIDEVARRLNPYVKQVSARLQSQYEVILIVRKDGQLIADVRPLVKLNVNVIVERNGKREQGFSGGGARTDYRYFLEENRAIQFVEQAIHQAIVNLDALPAPAGSMPVVLGPGWPGVLLHEAIGHGLEADFNRKGSSAFSGRLGEKVATSKCTVVDDGTLLNQRGSLTVDDEGTPTECTVLIENGILKAYMQDRLNARLMGSHSTGNGRRESYAHLPMPRMTNTYMLAGSETPEEIIASVDRGLYAVNFSGGQVDITSGKFVFSACEAYLIEGGKVTYPVKGAMLIGNGPEVLTRVSMVGNDLKLDSGIGSCGKAGQTVPVSVGQPTLKVDALTVGGTDYVDSI